MIYFIQGEKTQLIKIGFVATKQTLGRRLTELRSHNADRLVVLAITNNFPESKIHKEFKSDWNHHEWFNPSERLLNFINSLKFYDNIPVAEINRNNNNCYERLKVDNTPNSLTVDVDSVKQLVKIMGIEEGEII